MAPTAFRVLEGHRARLKPDPGNVGPCAAVGARCADRGGGGERQHGMNLGNSSPDARSGLAISLAKQPVRLRSKFLGAAELLWSGHWVILE
jgi:hypothetical protein